MGKHYPAYHCSNHGHYYRIPKQEFEATIAEFVKSISISTEKLDALTDAVMTVWEKKHESVKEDTAAIQKRIDSLVRQKYAIVDKVKIVSSVTAIEMLEADLVQTDQEIAKLEATMNDATQADQALIFTRLSHTSNILWNTYTNYSLTSVIQALKPSISVSCLTVCQPTKK